jgi:L-alanine-DL-glutamate epimerase-like enolase superfamily enzyme
MGVFYMGDTPASMMFQIESMRSRLERGLTRMQLQDLLPPGGARNAMDAALWDLEAKTTGQSVWQLSGVAPRPLETVFTIGLEATPQGMAEKAAAAVGFNLLKIKLDGHEPLARVQAIRAARGDARLVVDANQGWSFEQLKGLAPALADLGVQMIEQPLPRNGDSVLCGYRCPVPLFADESCQHLEELEQAAARYQGINIKLDKTGGLTHALALASAARIRGLGLMVGNMGGCSLVMAPSFVVGCVCDWVDIDGPLLQRSDRLPGIRFVGGHVPVFGPSVWGGGSASSARSISDAD